MAIGGQPVKQRQKQGFKEARFQSFKDWHGLARPASALFLETLKL
jgi:hypothetical protein